MAESIAGDAAFLGGVEIVNTARTIAYLNNGVGPGSLNVSASCGCPDLIELIGCDEEYVNPATDNAPWYSTDHPESADFAGFFMEEFEGLDSSFTRETNENVGNGGALGRSRVGSRTLTWRGYLFGASCCAVSYGLRWLEHTLRLGAQECGGCQGQDLEIIICCPDPDDVSPTGIEPFRMMKNVSLLEGPTILSERRSSGSCNGVGGGCGGSVIMEIEFSLFAANPWLFRPEVPIVNCIPFTEAGPRITVEEPPCPPIDCGQDFFNVYLEARGCAVPELPPAATYSIDCLELPGDLEQGLYITIPRNAWREFEEAVPYIVIESGDSYITDLQLGFYTSNSGDPCGDLSNNAPDCDLICDKLTILTIPAESKFIIDGRTRTMSVVCGTNIAFPGERFTLGAFSWPVFNCYGFCLEILFSLSNPSNPFLTVPNLGNGCISVSMIPRTL